MELIKVAAIYAISYFLTIKSLQISTSKFRNEFKDMRSHTLHPVQQYIFS